MSVTKIISGSGIDINPIDGTGDVTVSTNGDMTVTNLIPSYQSTMLNYITSATQLVFSGDSITFDPVPYSWSTLLSENYNKEKINIAYPGDCWPDQIKAIYNKWEIKDKPICPHFLACGINDMNASIPSNQDAIVVGAIAELMYATLPSECFKLLRLGSEDIKITGLWKNNPNYTNL